MVCPTSALHERSYIDELQNALCNKDLTTVVQYSPAVSVSLAESFGLKPGKDVNGLIVAALHKIGFKYVFDTSFAADIAIMETAYEINERINSGNTTPLLSGNCPSWVRYLETFSPDLLPNLSTVKSPQQIMGAIVKSYFAKEINVNPNNIYSVSIMPCIANKSEAKRPEMTSRGINDVDVVLSTRELVRLIRLYGIDINNIEPQQPDTPFGVRSSAGKLYGASGGSTEGILRTLHFMRTGKDMATPKINELRSVTGVKEVSVKMGKETINVLVASGLTTIRDVLASIKSGSSYNYVEVMACSGGCVNGGGQPFGFAERDIKVRTKALYEIDEIEIVKNAHRNTQVHEVYQKYFENPGSEKAKKLFHVSYSKDK